MSRSKQLTEISITRGNHRLIAQVPISYSLAGEIIDELSAVFQIRRFSENRNGRYRTWTGSRQGLEVTIGRSAVAFSQLAGLKKEGRIWSWNFQHYRVQRPELRTLLIVTDTERDRPVEVLEAVFTMRLLPGVAEGVEVDEGGESYLTAVETLNLDLRRNRNTALGPTVLICLWR